MKDFIFLLSTTLMYATPLIFTSIGGILSEKSGVINIGLEGMMIIGAFFASVTAIKFQNPYLGLLCGGIAGLIFSLLHAISSIKFKANQVVVGIALNFLGSGIAIFLCRLIFDGTSMTPPLDLEHKLPSFFGQFITTYLSIVIAIIVAFIFNKTVFGLRLISSGEHKEATLSCGINANFYRYVGVLSSGFLAGLGGASLSIAIVSNFRPTLISGQGFIAIAALIFGKWKPIPTLLACLFFGFSQSLVIYFGGMESIKISSQLLSILPYLLTIIILITLTNKSGAPSDLGN